MRNRLIKIAIGAAWGAGAGAIAYPLFLRRQCLTWGATAEEVSGKLPGDELPLGPDRPMMRVEVCDPGRALVIRIADGDWVWIFALTAEDGRTRLISRNRIAMPGAALPARVFNMLVMEPGSLVMERKMLLGIKQRAENLAGEQGPGTV